MLGNVKTPEAVRWGLRATALVLLLGVAVWWGLGRRTEVSVTAVVSGDAAQVVYATGIVEPVSWSKVAALQRKRIIEICSCEGQPVKKGDILARLDDVEERSTLVELTARRDRIKEDVDRVRGLVERNVSSRVAYDEKATQLREYDARLAAQRDRIADLELRAPMDGVVLRRDGEVGEIAGTANNDVLLWVGQPKPLRVVADVNEEDIIKVEPGQKVLLRHESQPAEPLSAVVDSITPKGDPATKTFRAYFLLPDETPLKIGMSVEANVIVREVKGVLLVPTQAVLDGHVLVAEGGRIRRQRVKLGVAGTRMVEVVEGLALGQAVVTPASAALKDGTRISVAGEQRP